MSEHDELERRRLERIVATQQDELIAAKQAAATALAAKSAFLARMSHEIRTPLNTIIGLNHIMLRDVSDPKQQAQVDKVLGAAEHLLGLVDDILDLSKIEAGQVTLVHSDFLIEHVLASVAGRISALARAKGLSIGTAIAPEVPHVLCGDAARLRQLLLNFATNAVKFTERGSVQLAVALKERTESEAVLRFAVTDTGIGLTDEQRGHLFQAFEQVDGGASRRYAGTGLGLALCRQLASLLGGRVGVESQPGKGTTFWFEAPFETRVATGREGGALRARQAGNRRVLLVDDDALSYEVAEFLLRSEGFDVDVACDGRDAVERAASGAYAAVLMDIQMPRMGGLEATRVIRRFPEHASTPIIAMTSNVFEEDRRACFDAGMSDLVAKPIDPAHLSAALARWVPAVVGRTSTEGTAESSLQSSVVPRPQARTDPTAREQLLQLQRLVATDDMDARDHFRTLSQAVCGSMHGELGRRLEDFDYDQAGILIAARLQQLELEWTRAMNRD